MRRFVKVGDGYLERSMLPNVTRIAHWVDFFSGEKAKGDPKTVIYIDGEGVVIVTGTPDEVAAAIEAAMAGETPADTTPEPAEAAEAPVELRVGQV